MRLKKEQEEREKKRKEKVEARLHTIIKVARDEDLSEQIGKEIYFDLVNHDKVTTFHVEKQMPFNRFKEEVAKTFRLPVQFQRYWLWMKRPNRTYRPHRALTIREEFQPVGQLSEESNEVPNAELKLFLVKLCPDLRPLSGGVKTIKEEILLFFKLYDPLEEKIRYVGRLFVKGSGKPLEILSNLKEFAGFSPNEEIELFEEIKFQPRVICEKIDSMLSFRDSELVDGDIICFQKSLQNQFSEHCRFREVSSFLEYVHNRQIRLEREQEEKEQKRKEKAEACLYTTIKIARDEDLGDQIGKEIYFDLVDYDKVRTFCIQQHMAFAQLKEEVAKAFGIPMQFQRYWLWRKRQNYTYRPYRALTAQEEMQSVNELRVISNNGNDAELKLYLEVELFLDLRSFSPPGKDKEEILLFFKLYNPLKENIRYVGRLSVNINSKPLEILSNLKEFAGFSPNEEIELFEEIKFEPSVMCEKIDSMLSFRDCMLDDGDIICFQKSLRNQCNEWYRFPEVPAFLEHVHKRQEEVAKAFGIPVQFQRYWLWAKRQNHTYRPDRALTAQEEIHPVNELRVISNKGNDAELNLYLEVELCMDLRPAPPGKTKEEILLFFKLYDPLKENIRYVGRLFVKVSGKPLEILSKLKEFAGFSPNEETELFEEIKFEPSVLCEKIDSMLSFRDCKLEDGDIICFQKSLRNERSEQYRFPEVPSFLEYMHNRLPKEHEMPVPSSGFPTKRPRPSKVAPVDTTSVGDPASARFTWTVDNFSRWSVKKLYSDTFIVGGYKWRILILIKEINADHLSFFLEAADAAALPYGWSRYAQFSLAVLDQVHGKFTVKKETRHKFNAKEIDWGFTSFMPLTELNDPGRGYLVDDTLILEADVSMLKSR